jgi:hypothetical protein
LNYLVATPNGSPRHIDIQSVDMYWFAGAKPNSNILGQGGLIYNLGSPPSVCMPLCGIAMTVDQGARGNHYGDMVDRIRALQTMYPAPLFQIVEDGGPYNEDTSASYYITPPELNWAVWSSIIHGARGIIYFNHTFAGPAISYDNLAQSYYKTVQPSQTISIYNQVKATNALIKQVAPVINSPKAVNYAAVDPAPTTFAGIDMVAKYYNGQFYIIATTRESETKINTSATFTLADHNATTATVVNESRTIPINNGVFTDMFAHAWTVHIYQIN